MWNMAASDASNCKVVLAGTIAKSLLKEVSADLDALGRPPRLLGILANNDPAAKMYADWTQKTCEENGFAYTLTVVPKDTVEETIISANNDDSIDGLIIYYPIFGPGQDNYLQQVVSPAKDVEGLNHQYIFNMYQNIRFLDQPSSTPTAIAGTATSDTPLDPTTSASTSTPGTTPQPLQKSILPCTPLAVIKILEHLQIYNTILPYGNRLFGHTILVVNRSEVVGRPLAALLANDGAKVYSADISGIQLFTRGAGLRNRKHVVTELPDMTLSQCTPQCDVVISGVPGSNYKFPTEHLRDGAVCINVSSEKNFDAQQTKQKAAIYVPAIGKVTIAVLMRNLMRIVMNKGAARSIAAAATAASSSSATVSH